MAVKQALDAIDPRLWWVAISLAVYLVVFFWKNLSAKLPEWASFERVPTKLRALPALLLAAAIGAAGLDSAEIGRNLLDLVLAVIAGVTSVGAHETMSRLTGKSGQTQ